MSKDYQCPKCHKFLSRKQALQEHMEKKVPCDLVCRVCGYKSPNRKACVRHIERELKKKEGMKRAQKQTTLKRSNNVNKTIELDDNKKRAKRMAEWEEDDLIAEREHKQMLLKMRRKEEKNKLERETQFEQSKHEYRMDQIKASMSQEVSQDVFESSEALETPKISFWERTPINSN